ncbi:MAG: polyprenyl synthetase family protein [Gammaproteobacteria bacterium]
MNLDQYLDDVKRRVEAHLDEVLPSTSELAPALIEAIRYSVLAPGKRLRPILAYATCEALGGDPELALTPGCALELIHAYSLIHDDLPAMDDDDLRRGRPTCHRAFGEATAILAGDALQPMAFELIAEAPGLGMDERVAMITTVAKAVGPHGMVGGQSLDLSSEGQRLTAGRLEVLHGAKTGQLLRASVLVGALASGKADEAALERLARYGTALGLAFQVVDDILDVTGDVAVIGKTPGADEEAGKNTYPSLLTLEGARDKARILMGQALDAIEDFGPGVERLRELARFVIERDR